MAAVNNHSTSIQRTAEALRASQSLTDDDIQRVASLSSNQPHINPTTPATSPLRSEISRRSPTLQNSRLHHYRARSVGSTSTSTGTSGRRARARSASPPLKRGRLVSKSLIYKDLVIIPLPETSKVPTHNTRVELEKNGLVVSDFPFDKSWDAATLSEKIKEQLPLAYIPFQFVKACYGSLVLPKLAQGVDLTCEVLMKISGQGSVYVRLLEEHNPEEEESIDHVFRDIFTDESEDETNEAIPEIGNGNNPDVGNDDPVFAYADMIEDHPSVSTPIESPVVADENNDFQEFPQVLLNDENQVETPRQLLVREIVVKRSNIVKPLISEFKDDDILKYSLVFVFMGDNGILEEGRGLGRFTREVLSLFWREFSVAFSIGASEKVPSIRHDHQTSEWVSVARILTYGFKEEGFCHEHSSQAAYLASIV